MTVDRDSFIVLLAFAHIATGAELTSLIRVVRAETEQDVSDDDAAVLRSVPSRIQAVGDEKLRRTLQYIREDHTDNRLEVLKQKFARDRELRSNEPGLVEMLDIFDEAIVVAEAEKAKKAKEAAEEAGLKQGE